MVRYTLAVIAPVDAYETPSRPKIPPGEVSPDNLKPVYERVAPEATLAAPEAGSAETRDFDFCLLVSLH